MKGEFEVTPASAVSAILDGFVVAPDMFRLKPVTPFHAAAWSVSMVVFAGTVMVISPPLLDVPILIPLLLLTVHSEPFVPAVSVTLSPHACPAPRKAITASRTRLRSRVKLSNFCFIVIKIILIVIWFSEIRQMG